MNVGRFFELVFQELLLAFTLDALPNIFHFDESLKKGYVKPLFINHHNKDNEAKQQGF
jgi:hypothetical protein